MKSAAAAGRAVPAFNVITLESAEAVVAGSQAVGVGVLLQVSENAIRFHGGAEPLLAACRELATAASTGIGIHLDHVADLGLAERLIEKAPEFGIGSIMFDASERGDAENATTTARIATRAHAAGLWVEAELGAIGGKGGVHAPGVRTGPAEAAAFVDATGVDGLAVAVGTQHAMRDRSAVPDVDLIRRIGAAVPVPLVLHGSSGVSDHALSAAVRAGIRKVNVGTALNAAWASGLVTYLTQNPDQTDPRRYSAQARADMTELVVHLCRVVAADEDGER